MDRPIQIWQNNGDKIKYSSLSKIWTNKVLFNVQNMDRTIQRRQISTDKIKYSSMSIIWTDQCRQEKLVPIKHSISVWTNKVLFNVHDMDRPIHTRKISAYKIKYSSMSIIWTDQYRKEKTVQIK